MKTKFIERPDKILLDTMTNWDKVKENICFSSFPTFIRNRKMHRRKMNSKKMKKKSTHRVRPNQIIKHMILIPSFNIELGPHLLLDSLFIINLLHGEHVWRFHCSHINFVSLVTKKNYFFSLYFWRYISYLETKLTSSISFLCISYRILNIHGKAHDLWIFCSICSFMAYLIIIL